MTQEKSSLFSKATISDEIKNHYSGILWFIATGFLSTVINTTMRVMSEKFGYHPLQLVFFYSLLGAMLYIPSFIRHQSEIHTPHMRTYMLRGILEVTGFSLVFASVLLLPFAMLITLTFVTPIIGSIAAVYFLGEKMTQRKLIGLACGFSGIIIVSQPDAEHIHWAVFLPLAASFCFASCSIIIRKLTVSEPPKRIAFITLSCMAVISLPMAIYVWKPIEWQHLPYLAWLGLLVASVQFSVGQALKRIELTTAQPFTFLNLIWSSLIGYALFHETVAMETILGGILIIAGVVYSSRRPKISHISA